MRRSTAPSQINVTRKRHCFRVPFVSDQSRPHFVSGNKENISSTSKDGKEPGRSTDDILNLFTKQPSSECEQNVKCLQSAEQEVCYDDVLRRKPEDNVSEATSSERSSLFNTFYKNSRETVHKKQVILEAADKDISNKCSRYFSVLWCKLSKKKHKKWEGDAILIIQGRTAKLKDLEGKELSRAVGYKAKEVENLVDGQIFVVGGKECEIQCKLKEESISNKNLQESSTQPVLGPSCQQAIKKSFATSLWPSTTLKRKLATSDLHYSHPKDFSGALVMPRPSSAHQWEHNKAHLQVTDVIVDSSLAAQLRLHQKEGVVFLYESIMGMRNGGMGAILADEMGLGKTLQCITLIWTLCKQGPYGGIPVLKRVIVITPSSLVKNWLQEFHKWLGHGKLTICAVDSFSKIQEYVSSCQNVLILSYEMFVRGHEILHNVPFDLVICDEGHRIKNSGIKTANLIASLSTRRRILLTGTPIQNDLQEFFSIVEFCNPGILGTSSTFRKVFEDPIIRSRRTNSTSHEKEVGEERAAKLSHCIGSFFLRRTHDVIKKYLPLKVESVVFCKMTGIQLALYLHCLDYQKEKNPLSAGTPIDGSGHLMLISTLRKLCNHPNLLYSKALSEERVTPGLEDFHQHVMSAFPENFGSLTLKETSGKMKVLSSLLSSIFTNGQREKIVIISNFTQTLDILEFLCKSNGYSFLRLDGSTPSASRQQIVDTFNSPTSQYFVFLLSSKAGGVGLNLVGASHIVLYDIDWNPANDLQAMARVWRDGQKRPVHAYRLLTTGTIEEKIYQRQITKQELTGAVIDLKDSKKVQFSAEELKDLFTLQQNTNCSTHELMQCHCCEADLEEAYAESQKPDMKKEQSLRACQLSTTKSVPLIKNVSMADLFQWSHISGPISSFQDKHLSSAGEDVTFIFQNESEEKSDCIL